MVLIVLEVRRLERHQRHERRLLRARRDLVGLERLGYEGRRLLRGAALAFRVGGGVVACVGGGRDGLDLGRGDGRVVVVAGVEGDGSRDGARGGEEEQDAGEVGCAHG